MHVTKNVCESLLATIVNMPDRTKDGPKARHDLEFLGIKKELHGPPDNDDDDDDDETMDEDTQGARKRAKRRDVVFPAACFTLSEKELEQFFKCLLGVKVSHGYSGNCYLLMAPEN
jgi:hypothetical protein